MKDKSLIYLGAVIALYSLSSSIIGIFLPTYYLELGLSINQIIILVACMIAMLGVVPFFILRFLPKYFERMVSVGVISTILFYVCLIYVKNPLVIGIVYGIAMAAFWPPFNLLVLRLSNIKRRGLIVSLVYIVIPGLIGVFGPALGGTIIQFFGFNCVFLLSILVLIAAFFFSFGIKVKPVTSGIMIPKQKLMFIFAAIVIIGAISGASSWIAYPLFLHTLSEDFLQMGFVATAISLVCIIIAFIAGKVSEVHKRRLNFAVFGALMASAWLIAMSFVRTIPQLIGISIFIGLANAFWIALFSMYGDFFKRKYHATLVVLWEFLLMIGRLAGLVPVYVFINQFDFGSYYWILGLISLIIIIPYAILQYLHYKGKIKIDSKQI